MDPRRLVKVGKETVSAVSSTDYPGNYPGEDHSWNLAQFENNLSVKVYRLSDRTIEFDLVGVDASIANAFRRILIAEVPTVAIEGVYVWNNTSVIQDEILAHRLGLIPLNIDPHLVEYKIDGATDRNTVVFKLHIACERNKQASRDEKDPEKLYIDSNVYSRHLEWDSRGEQKEIFAKRPPRPCNENILLAKLRPGQEIEVEMHANKGVGKEHAKWSPVATASYRLLPDIKIAPAGIPPHLCQKFANCFSPGVIEVRQNRRTGQKEVVVKNARKESMSREVLRHPEFEGLVELGRVRDHFLWSIESEGPYVPEELFPQAISVMREKIAALKVAAESFISQGIDQPASQPAAPAAAADGDIEMAST